MLLKDTPAMMVSPKMDSLKYSGEPNLIASKTTPMAADRPDR